jgi:hypothetical protein
MLRREGGGMSFEKDGTIFVARVRDDFGSVRRRFGGMGLSFDFAC